MKYNKIIKSIFALLIATTLFTSCQKEVLLKKDGEWNYIYTYVYTGLNGNGSGSSEETGTYTFEKEGKGNRKTNSGDVTTFTWSRSDKTITMTYTGGGTLNYTVIKDEKKTQEMTSKTSDVNYIYNRTLKLTR